MSAVTPAAPQNSNTAANINTEPIPNIPTSSTRTLPSPRFITGEDVDPLKEERTGLIREVGCQAIWSLSSCKPDASIWLHQSVKGFRDADGNPLRNAHLLGVFYRASRLLSSGIKPIFVFDGGIPVLKKQTIAARRERKIEAEEKSKLSRQKILTNYIQRQFQKNLVQNVANSQSEADEKEKEKNAKKAKKGNYTKPQRSSLFGKNNTTNQNQKSPKKSSASLENEEVSEELQKIKEKMSGQLWTLMIPDTNKEPSGDSSSSEGEIDFAPRGKNYAENFSIIQSEDFDYLPLETQHEILFDMQESKKMNSWGKIDQMPKQSSSFSSYQMDLLLKRRTLQNKIKQVQKEMGQEHIRLQNFDEWESLKMFEKEENDEDEDDSAEFSEVVIADQEKGMILLKKPSSSGAGDTEKNTIKDEKPSTSANCANINKNKPDIITIDDYIIEDEDSLSDYENENNLKNKIDADAKNLKNNEILKLKEKEENDDDDEDEDLKMAIQMSLEEDNKIIMEKNQKNDFVKSDSEDSSSDDFQEVEDKNENEPIIILPPSPISKKPEEGKGEIITISFDTNFKPEEDIFADIFANNKEEEEVKEIPSVSEVKVQEEPPEEVEIMSSSDNEEVEEEKEEIQIISKDNIEKWDTELDELMADVTKDEIKPRRFIHQEDSLSDVDEEDLNSNSNNIPIQMISKEYLQKQQLLNEEKEELLKARGNQERIATSISEQMCIEAQELLALFGIPYIISINEAESQCAFLDTACLTDGTITDDSDIWLFGGQRVYKNFFSHGDRQLTLFQYADIVQKLNLDREKLILLGILTGTDYTEGIEKVGPVTALEILAEFSTDSLDSFDTLIKFREWWDIYSSAAGRNQKVENKIREKFRKLDLSKGFPNRNVYDAYKNPEVDSSTEEFRWGIPDLDALKIYAKDKFGWTPQKSEATLLPLIKVLKLNCQQQLSTVNERQLTLDNFVIGRPLPTLENKGKRKLKSKRMDMALKRIKTIKTGNIQLSESESSSSSDEKEDEEESPLELALLKDKIVSSEKISIPSIPTSSSFSPPFIWSEVSKANYKPRSFNKGSHNQNQNKKNLDDDDEFLKNKPSTSQSQSVKKPEIIHQKLRYEDKKKANKLKAIQVFNKKNK